LWEIWSLPALTQSTQYCMDQSLSYIVMHKSRMENGVYSLFTTGTFILVSILAQFFAEYTLVGSGWWWVSVVGIVWCGMVWCGMVVWYCM
jgi:polyferredoxin